MQDVLNTMLSPTYLWLVFLILASFVAYLAIMLSKTVAALSDKTKLGGAFLGGFVLSLVTSLPELITSITASAIENPTLSYNNIFGANAFTAMIIALLDIVFIRKYIFHCVSKMNVHTITIVLIINLFIFLSLVSGNGLEFTFGSLKISYLFFAVFVFYLYFIYIMYQNNEVCDEEPSRALQQYSLKAILLIFFLVSISLVVVSTLLTRVANIMGSSEGYNLGNGVVGALFLSICTGLPEAVSAFSLAKMGKGNLAIGGIVGSHLFNITILFYGDLFYLPRGTFQKLIDSSEADQFLRLIIMNIVFGMFLLLSTRRDKIQNKAIYILPSLIIVVSYLLGWLTGYIR